MQENTIISVKFPRSKGFYKLRRKGQEPPHLGDRVQVEASIMLPHDKNDHKLLDPSIEFGSRVKIGDRSLYSAIWADFEIEGYHGISRTFKAETWKEAFEQARSWAEEELNKLEEALKKREEALIKAEEGELACSMSL